jgi:hypothetical protein
LKHIAILETASKELKAYSWMKPVENFINETKEFLSRNQTHILIEQVIFDLETDKNASYYKKAIDKLRSCSESENPVFDIVETLSEEKWIPLVKKLYEYASKLKGSVLGENPNFKVSKVYSPVEAISESTFMFYSSGKVLEFDGNSIYETETIPSNSFKSLINVSENAKFNSGVMRIYPNINSILDIEFVDEQATVKLNNKDVDSKDITSRLLTAGYLKTNEVQKSSFIQHAIAEGHKIKEIDFAYKVTSSIFEGLSSTVFSVNNKIYIQNINKGMRSNDLFEAQNAEEAVRIVKDFMNYDITSSVSHLLENEKAEADRRQREIAKVESKIKFLMESLEDLERLAKVNGVEDSEHIKKAKAVLEGEIANQRESLRKFGLVEATDADGFKPTSKKDIITEFTVGHEYTVNGVEGYTYQGITDGMHIFNNDKGAKPSPVTFTEEEAKTAKIEKA